MVQGRRSRQRAPGPRRRCSMAPCSLLPAPCSMLPHGDWRRGMATTRRIALRTSRQCRRLATGSTVSRSSCSTAGHLDDLGRPLPLVGWPGWGEGGRARCWIGTGGVPQRWGAMGTELENVACGAVGRRSRRGRWALGSELPLGERDVDGIFGARRWTVHVPSSTPWQMDSRHWPPSAVGQWWAWRRVGTATPHRLKGVAPANRLTARHSPPARPPCPPSLSRAGLGPSDWPGGGKAIVGDRDPASMAVLLVHEPPFVSTPPRMGQPVVLFPFFFPSFFSGSDGLATTTTHPHTPSPLGRRRPPPSADPATTWDL